MCAARRGARSRARLPCGTGPEPGGEVLRPVWAAVLPAEDPVPVAIDQFVQHTLPLLAGTVFAQDRDHRLTDPDPAFPAALWFLLNDPVVALARGHGPLPPDVQQAAVEVEVRPAKAGEFPTPQATDDGERPCRVQAVVAYGLQERCRLIRCPHAFAAVVTPR